MADTVQTIKQLVAAKADTAAALAKEIWNYAELSYEETRSAAALIGALKNEGFTIEEGNIPAFRARMNQYARKFCAAEKSSTLSTANTRMNSPAVCSVST